MCHIHNAEASSTHAESGCKMDLNGHVDSTSWILPPTNTRWRGANAHKHVAAGCAAEISGAETRIRISCCNMWALKSCSPSAWIGDVSANMRANQPLKKLA